MLPRALATSLAVFVLAHSTPASAQDFFAGQTLSIAVDQTGNGSSLPWRERRAQWTHDLFGRATI